MKRKTRNTTKSNTKLSALGYVYLLYGMIGTYYILLASISFILSSLSSFRRQKPRAESATKSKGK